MRHFLLLIGLLVSVQVIGQHCPFDYAHILVMRITSEKGNNSIPNLKVTVLDSAHNPVAVTRWHNSVYIKDTLRLFENPKKTTQLGRIDNNNPMNPSLIHFWFAKDNYVLVTHAGLPGPYVKIEDRDSAANGGSFKTKIVTLDKDKQFSLCTGRYYWPRGKGSGFYKDYRPIKVILEKLPFDDKP